MRKVVEHLNQLHYVAPLLAHYVTSLLVALEYTFINCIMRKVVKHLNQLHYVAPSLAHILHYVTLSLLHYEKSHRMPLLAVLCW